MKEFVKRQYKNLILVAVYLILANLIYIIWFNDLWHLWYVDLITGLVITGLGGYIGYRYLMSEDKKYLETHNDVDAKDVEIKVEKKDNKAE